MALLGLLYLIGTRKGQHTDVREVWTADGTGIQILRACMSYDRFPFLLRCIHFDDLQTRPGIKQAAQQETDYLCRLWWWEHNNQFRVWIEEVTDSFSSCHIHKQCSAVKTVKCSGDHQEQWSEMKYICVVQSAKWSGWEVFTCLVNRWNVMGWCECVKAIRGFGGGT
jgi:hypothetical protein